MIRGRIQSRHVQAKKYYVYIVVDRATSVRVIKEHISYFGVPIRLITDKGTSFTSKIFQEFITSFGIQHIVNAVATPRANGQVERFNRTILDALSISSHGKDKKNLG